MKKIDSSSTASQTTIQPDNLLENKLTSSLSLHENLSGKDNFIQSTQQGYYAYWLTLTDVIDIARVEYNNFKQFKSISGSLNSDFQTLNSLEHLIDTITNFQKNAKQIGSGRMTLITNTGYARWITMVLSYHENYQKNFKIIYIDSANHQLTTKFNYFFQREKVLFYDLSIYLHQHMDTYDVGLCALEIANDLNKMLDENYDLLHMVVEFDSLFRNRNTRYFKQKRKNLVYKLSSDISSITSLTQPSTSGLSKATSSSSSPFVTQDESKSKKQKIESEEERIQIRLELFVESFIKRISELLAVYHVTAKGARLNTDNLRKELTTGATGALLGITIALGITGSIPSLVATIRSISGHYYFAKDKACRVTKAFETIASGELSPLLGLVALDIFYSFENQFISVTDKAGYKIAIEKLAEDAAVRLLNYISELEPAQLVTQDLLSQAVLLGKSEKYFNVKIKPLRIFMKGTTILAFNSQKISTSDLYEKTGVRIFNSETQETKFYQLKKFSDRFTYGYRRLLQWEKQENGEPTFSLVDYQEVLRGSESQKNTILQEYKYYLDKTMLEQKTHTILEKLKKNIHILPKIIAYQKAPIRFNLRKAVNNFSGRKEVLDNLHKVLTADTHIAVVTQEFSRLSLDKSSNSKTNSAQISLSGLGGVGKTQLALRYAELYANYYDDNVIWINAETQNDIVNSFLKLTPLLNISTKNSLGDDKNIDELLPEIYDYFKDKKSLFIFDNVENYREFEKFLPVSTVGKPSVLITSRFSHWINILPVITLDVFMHQEAIDFVKKELAIYSNEHNPIIIELINLLHCLPLGLQQAVAYITMQKYVNSKFSINDYVNIFNEKTEELLRFDFSEYTNNSYLKSVFITWNVTLDKIRNNKNGVLALDILNMMAYLFPDHISNKLFLNLESSENLNSAIHLLKSYSMINMGSQQDISVIHRLVQTVIRINLEKDFFTLQKNAERIFHITQGFYNDFELSIHYIYFLLYMNQISKLSHRLKLGITKNRVIEILTFSADKIPLKHLYDAARLILTKSRYFTFIGNAIFIYIKHGFLFFLSETISYIEKNLENGILTNADVREILSYQYKASEEDPANWLVSNPEGRERQIQGVRFISDFQKKFLFKKSSSCSFRKRKRKDTLCIRETANITSKLILIQSHLKLVARCANLASLEQKESDIILPDFSSEEWGHVSLPLEKTIEIFLVKKAFHIKLLSEELSSIAKKNLLEKKETQNSTDFFDFFNKKLEEIYKLKSYVKKTIAIIKPFTKLSRFSIDHSHNFAKELKDYRELKNLKALKDTETKKSTALNILTDISTEENYQFDIDVAKEAEEFLEVLFEITEPEVYLEKKAFTLGRWLVKNIYRTAKKVNQIEKFVHLDKREWFIESIKAFVHASPSNYLEAKAINNQLIKTAIAFLKENTFIQQYIFPSATLSLTLAKDNQVFLQSKEKLKLDPTVPDKPKEGTLFCLPGKLGSEFYVKSSQWVYIEPYPPFMRPKNLENTYLCNSALGIEYSQNRTGNITLIDLNEGNDKAIGIADVPNIFIVKNGNKHYKGGDVENLFLIQDWNITGILEGGKNFNVIKLVNFILDETSYALFDKKARLCLKKIAELSYQCPDKGLQLKNIQHFYGSNYKKDIIFINNDMQYIDGLGGKNNAENDHIYLTACSPKNLWIMLRPYTIMHAFIPGQTINSTIINYQLIPQNGSALVQVDWNKSIYHQFHIEFSLSDLFILFTSKNEIGLNFFYKKNFFNLKIMLLEKNYGLSTFHFSDIHFFLPHQEFKLISEHYLFIRDLSDQALNELVENYLPLSLRLQKIIQIYSVKTKIMIHLSHNQPAILYNEPTLKNYLISQEKKTVYLIKPSLKETDFYIPEVVIYSVKTKNILDTLDLREIKKHIEKICPNAILILEIIQKNQDLILTLKIKYQWQADFCVKQEMFSTIATIKLLNALTNNTYQNLEIFLYNIPSVIAFNEQKKWHLETYSLFFTHKKKLIFISKNELILGADIVVLKERDNGVYRFFCHKETDLVITNSLDPFTPIDEFCTIVYSQYYKDALMRALVLTSTLTFIDQQILLKKFEEKINNVPCFDLNQINSTFLINHVFYDQRFGLNEDVDKTKRRKRQIEIKNNNIKNKSNYYNSKNVKKLKSNFFQTMLPKRNTLLPYLDNHFTHFSPKSFLANNDIAINNQSIFFSWIYHTLWGRKAKSLNFKTIELDYENQIYKAIDKFETLQNQSSYSWY